MRRRANQALGRAVAYAKIYYQYVLSAGLAVTAALIVYWRDLEILVNEAFQSEAVSHVFLVPFLISFLLYQKKDSVKSTLALAKIHSDIQAEYLDEAIGTALCMVAFLLYWYGSYTFYPLEYHLLSLPLFVMGVTLILFNMKTLLALMFPILFLLFLIPPPAEALYTVSSYLANFNTQVSYGLLKTLRLPVTLESSYGPPTIAVATSGQSIFFSIDLPCSGVYSLLAFFMLATFLAYIAVASISKKAALFVLGFFVFETLNVIRISTIISVGYLFGEEAAMLIFHNAVGWVLIFAGMMLVLFMSERIWKIQFFPAQGNRSPCTECRTSSENFETFCSNCGKFLGSIRSKISRRFLTKLILLLLGCYILTLAVSAPTFVIAQGPGGPIGVASDLRWENATRILPTTTDIPKYRDLYQDPRYLYRDVDYEKLSGQDASLLYAYFPLNTSNPTIYVDIGVSNSISNLHNWEVCLITWQIAQGQQPTVNVLDSKDIQLLDNASLTARFLVFEHPYNYTQITLYWFEKVLFKTGLTVEQRYVRISLVTLLRNVTLARAEYPQYEDQLLVFGKHIGSYWEPLKTQSLISLGVPTLQLMLGLTVSFVAVTTTMQHSREMRKKTTNLRIFKNFASKKEKLVLQTIQDLAEEKRHLQTSRIVEAIHAKANSQIDIEELRSILSQLEEYGFIKRDIVDIDNQPTLVWKVHIT